MRSKSHLVYRIGIVVVIVAIVTTGAVIGIAETHSGSHPSKQLLFLEKKLNAAERTLRQPSAQAARSRSIPIISVPAWAKHTVGVASASNMAFTSSKDGWYLLGGYVNGGGLLFHTTDGAKTWRPVPLTEKYVGNGIFFVNSNDGWIFGSKNGILHTADGGNTWTVENGPNNGMDNLMYVIEFASATQGWGVSNTGRLYSSSDAGSSWSQVTSAPSGLTDACQSSPTIGWVINVKGVWKTTDGGTTWTLSFPMPAGAAAGASNLSIACSGSNIWAEFPVEGGAGSNASNVIVSASTNGGASWSNVIVNGVSGQKGIGPQFPVGSGVWGGDNVAVNGSTAILFNNYAPEVSVPPYIKTYTSTNGGKSFTPVTVFNGTTDNVALSLVNSSLGWIALTDGNTLSVMFYETTDSGMTWTLAGTGNF